MTVLTMIIGPFQTDRSQETDNGLGAIGDEACRLDAGTTVQTGTLVSPFFR